MSMNQILAAFYGTNGVTEKTASAEDHEKAAQQELFVKIAASNGIDLSKLSDAQVAELYEKTFSEKTAGEMPPQFAAHMKGKDGEKDGKDGKKDEKSEMEEKAKKEHEEKKEAAVKMAEADFLGRQMAHAYVQELQKIAQAQSKTAAAAPAAGEWTVELPKVASAIDTLAMHRAFELVQEFNAGAVEHNKTASADRKLALIDEKDAAEKIASVHKKGLNESVKVAAAADHKLAVEVRALETLEAAGYPVEWKQ